MTTQHLDKSLDAVLRAAGSALKHYSMQKTKDDMRAAMQHAIESAPVRLDLLAALEGLLADKYLADPINADRMARARAAIAKAKGEA